MVVCKFFLQGNCRFGESCRNEHPGSGGGGGGFGGQNSNQNRYGTLSSNNRFGGGSNRNARKDTWQFNPDDIPNDLSAGKGRPIWILSSYGPGKNAPASLLQENEYSSEEVRARFYELAAQGKQDEADREAIALWSKAEQEINQVVSNARDVEKFLQEAERKHPNRDDFTQMDGTKPKDQIIKETEGSSSNMSGGFGSNPGGGFGSNTSSSPFGSKPASSFGQPNPPSGFGKPAFGQSGFGGGSPSGGAFGQAPSGGGFASNASSGGFAKPAFGQSAFGQPAQPSSAFGQSSQPSSAFGQPSKPASAFGQSSQASSAFGQPNQPATAFGQPSQPSSGFGQPAFGSSGGFGSNPPKNPFAPPSASGGFSQPATAFGQPSQPSSAFGQPSQPSGSFGQPNQLGALYRQPSQPSRSFGTPNQPGAVYRQEPQTSTVFGQPSIASTSFGQSPQQIQQPSTGGFGSNTSPFGQPTTTSSGFGSNLAPAFGQPSAPSNPFAPISTAAQPKDENMDTATPAVSRLQVQANPFGNPSTFAPSQPAALSASAIPNTNTSITPHPLLDRPPHTLHYTENLPQQPTQKNPAGKLAIFRGQPVTYENNIPYYLRPDTRELERVWFVDGWAGIDVQLLSRAEKIGDCEGAPDEYTEDVIAEYKHLFEMGSWKGGKVPLVPPLRQWAIYDF